MAIYAEVEATLRQELVNTKSMLENALMQLKVHGQEPGLTIGQALDKADEYLNKVKPTANELKAFIAKAFLLKSMLPADQIARWDTNPVAHD